jgi:hypothetical protein
MIFFQILNPDIHSKSGVPCKINEYQTQSQEKKETMETDNDNDTTYIACRIISFVMFTFQTVLENQPRGNDTPKITQKHMTKLCLV